MSNFSLPPLATAVELLVEAWLTDWRSAVDERTCRLALLLLELFELLPLLVLPVVPFESDCGVVFDC